MVLPVESMDEILKCELFIMLHKVVLTFERMDEIYCLVLSTLLSYGTDFIQSGSLLSLWMKSKCDHSNESY